MVIAPALIARSFVRTRALAMFFDRARDERHHLLANDFAEDDNASSRANDNDARRRDGDGERASDARRARGVHVRWSIARATMALTCAMAIAFVALARTRGGKVADARSAALGRAWREARGRATGRARAAAAVIGEREGVMAGGENARDGGDVNSQRGDRAMPAMGAVEPREVAFMTYSDRITVGVCMTGETAAMNGIFLNMIGVDTENGLFDFTYVANVKTRKLFAFLKILDDPILAATYGITDRTIVSVGDGTDVLYFRPEANVVADFKELEQLAHEGMSEEERNRRGVVVVSSERNCWPWMLHAVEKIPGGKEKCEQYPQEVGTSFKYLNSGNLIGRAKALRDLLIDVRDRMQSVNEDDQQILAEAYLRQIAGDESEKYVLALDVKQKLFQTAYDSALETTHYDKFTEGDAWYDPNEAVVKNEETHVLPDIVHFNGLKLTLVPVGRHYMNNHQPSESYRRIRNEMEQRYPWFKNVCAAINDKIRHPELEIAFSEAQERIVESAKSALGDQFGKWTKRGGASS